MNEEITSQGINKWIQAQLAKAHLKNEYAAIYIQIGQYQGFEVQAQFRIYHNNELQSAFRPTIEECFDEIASMTPSVAAAKKRAEAAKLMEEADNLEKEGRNDTI